MKKQIKKPYIMMLQGKKLKNETDFLLETCHLSDLEFAQVWSKYKELQKLKQLKENKK